MSNKTLLGSLLTGLAVAGAAHAQETTYSYDTVHSQILFSIDHNGYSRPFGRLHIAKGYIRFDPQHWDTAKTELDIDLQSLDMGDKAWNDAVLKPSFLDAAKVRYAHFVSTGVEMKDAQHGVLHGQFTLRGVTKPVDVNFTFNRVGKTIYGLHTVAGFSGVLSLDRNDFGMTGFKDSIGKGVSVWLELEAIKGGEAKDDAPAQEAPANAGSQASPPKG